MKLLSPESLAFGSDAVSELSVFLVGMVRKRDTDGPIRFSDRVAGQSETAAGLKGFSSFIILTGRLLILHRL